LELRSRPVATIFIAMARLAGFIIPGVPHNVTQRGNGLRMIKSLWVAASVALILQGCSKMQEPFLIVQMCLVDQIGVVQFKRVMRSIAKLEDL
jgi:hypothetical protein